MKEATDFDGPYSRRPDESPFDYNFPTDDDLGETVLLPDDTEVWFALVHKARAEVIAVGDDRDEVYAVADALAIPRSEVTVVGVPRFHDPDGIEFPDLP